MAAIVDSDLKVVFFFTLATTPRRREGGNSFLWIAPLYP